MLFPYASFRFNLSEAIRKKEPIDKVGVLPGVVVNVSPSRINAPDIIKIVVERDGQPVMPLLNLLQPKEMVTRLGVKRIIHAGSVIFPCSAFVPGASVTVIAIPESGTNIVKTIKSEELATRR